MLELEAGDDLRSNVRRGCRREGQRRRRPEKMPDRAKALEGGTKVRAPGIDAVRLVDDEPVDARRGHRVTYFNQQQLLRCEEHELDAAGGDRVERPSPFTSA